MTLTLARAAVRRHPLSMLFTALLVALSARLLGMPVPVALAGWATLSLFGITLSHTLEPIILRWLGCRSPSWLERERLDRALGSARLEVLVLDAAEPWLGHGLRTLIVSRALLDLLEDRAVQGILTQTVHEVRSASLAGELAVWLGNLPLVIGRLLGVWQIGRAHV